MKVKTNVRVGAYDCGQGGVYVVPSCNGGWVDPLGVVASK